VKAKKDGVAKGLAEEEAVVRFLTVHPDFLRDHPQLLDILEVSQGVPGAVSLLERQVRRLREQNERLRAHQAQLIAAARRNEDLGNRLHELALSLLEAEDAEDVVAVAREQLRSRCGLDAMGLYLWARSDPAPRLSFTLPQSEGDERFGDVIRGGRAVFPGTKDARVHDLLGCAELGSVVLVPLADGHWHGVLGLGSTDPERFREGMGTLFVCQLAALIARALRVRLEGLVDVSAPQELSTDVRI